MRNQSTLAATLTDLEAPGARKVAETGNRHIAFELSLLDAIDQAVIATDLDGRVVYWNRHAEVLYGWSAEQALGKTVMELKADPEHQDQAQEILDALKRGESWSGVITLRHRDGRRFPAHVTDSPVRDAAGKLIGIVGVSRDDSERQQAQRHQELLVNELTHRVKNTLTVVQSMAAQSFRADRPLTVARADFETRLMALARAHGLLIDEGWRAVSAKSLVDGALHPFGLGREERRVEIDGPDLELPARTAFALALALHELGTNAVKYGALSTPQGRVEIEWERAEKNAHAWLHLEWRELGGPAVVPPAKRGFGSRLIETGLASELRGEVDLKFARSGVVCSIRAPLS